MDIKGNTNKIGANLYPNKNNYCSSDILPVISSIASGCGSPINEITIEDNRSTTLKVNIKSGMHFNVVPFLNQI